MTVAASLIAEVHSRGGDLSIRGSRLHVEAPQPLPGDLMAALAAHKAELLKLLRPRPYHGWILTFKDRLMVVATPPDETAAELLRTYPDALHAMRLPYVEATDHAHAT